MTVSGYLLFMKGLFNFLQERVKESDKKCL